MAIIEVRNLKKYYQVKKKQPGFLGSVKNLFKPVFDEVKAVDAISFKIAEGELVGFIGPNGAGKTTTLKCLSGILYPTSGFVSVLGFVPWDKNPRLQKKISLLMGQRNQLWWDLPPLDSLLLQKEIYEIPDDLYQKSLDELIDLLEIKEVLTIPVRRLSLGQRMKCELLAALIHFPKVLFLDEPTIGLDLMMQEKVRNFIREYNQKYQAMILLTSHYMQDVEKLCKRIIIINKGKILFDGQLKEIIKKFGKEKILQLVFEKEVDKAELEKIGGLESYNFPEAIVRIKKEEVSSKSAEILKRFPVKDLSIEDMRIEEIVRRLFESRS